MGWILLVAPLAGAGLVHALRRRPGALLAASSTAMSATLVAAAWAAAAGPTAGWRWGPGLVLGLQVEGLSRVMVVLIPAVALPVLAYAVATVRHDDGLARLVVLLCVFVAAMELLVAAGDLLTLLVGWELVGACSWALIAHDWRREDNPRLAGQAFLATRVGDLGLLAAAAVALTVTGSAGFDTLSALRGWPAHVVAAGLVMAAAAKSAQLPFSPWLFSAMAGPTPVSALLHSATMVAGGAYLLARTVPLVEGAPWFAGAVAALGAATAVAAGVVATVQRDLKRALAASTSAQYGLVLVAVGAGSTAAAGSHLVTHAVLKALLFLGAGVALHAAATLDLGSLRLGRTLPFTAVTFLAGALALAGVPPLGAARSKEAILAAAAHHSPWLGAAVVVASFLSALYATRLALLAFGPGPLGGARHRLPGPVERASLAVLMLGSLALGALWLPGARGVAEGLTDGRWFDPAAWELPVSLAALLAAGLVVMLFHRRDHLLTMAVPDGMRRWLESWLGLPGLARSLIVDPVMAASRALASFDDRVVDAGVRAAARVPMALAGAAGWWGERGADGLVRAVSGATVRAAAASRVADERAVDRAVEQLARGTGVVGRNSRRLQDGLAHHYYVIVAAGLVATVVVAAAGR